MMNLLRRLRRLCAQAKGCPPDGINQAIRGLLNDLRRPAPDPAGDGLE